VLTGTAPFAPNRGEGAIAFGLRAIVPGEPGSRNVDIMRQLIPFVFVRDGKTLATPEPVAPASVAALGLVAGLDAHIDRRDSPLHAGGSKPARTAQDAFAVAERLLREGQQAVVIESFVNEALAIDPSFEPARRLKSQLQGSTPDVAPASGGEYDKRKYTAAIEAGMNAAQAGDLDAAEAQFQRAVAEAEKQGRTNEDLVGALVNLGATSWRGARHADALKHYTRAQSAAAGVIAPTDPRLGEIYAKVGGAHSALGQHAEAVDAYSRALANWERTLGTTHVKLAVVLTNLGAAMVQMGRPADAIGVLKRALDLRQQHGEPEYPAVELTTWNFALACKALGRFADAEILFERCMLARHKALGGNELANGEAMMEMAAVSAELAKHRNAEEYARWAVLVGDKHPSSDLAARARAMQARALRAMGRTVEAERVESTRGAPPSTDVGRPAMAFGTGAGGAIRAGLVSAKPPSDPGWEIDPSRQALPAGEACMIKCRRKAPGEVFFMLVKDYVVAPVEVMTPEALSAGPFRRNYEKLFTNLHVLSQRAVEFQGQSGYEVVMTMVHPKLGTIRKREVTLVKGTHVMVVSAEGLADLWGVHGAAAARWFDEVVLHSMG
jgi:tetratricopeptide (TPR) repeat protein